MTMRKSVQGLGPHLKRTVLDRVVPGSEPWSSASGGGVNLLSPHGWGIHAGYMMKKVCPDDGNAAKLLHNYDTI